MNLKKSTQSLRYDKHLLSIHLLCLSINCTHACIANSHTKIDSQDLQKKKNKIK